MLLGLPEGLRSAACSNSHDVAANKGTVAGVLYDGTPSL